MAITYGFNRDMGYNIVNTEMDKDEQYRYYTAMLFVTAREGYFKMAARDSGFSKETRHHIWLCLMGLMETWDII